MKKSLLAIVAMLMTSESAIALDKDFYTYNSFNEVLDAFKRMALIFNDATYTGLFLGISVLGIVVASFVTYTRGMSGQKINPLGYFAPIMVGGLLYTAVILPKGNVAIYDKTVNATETVAGVPDGLVFTMWLLNRIEYLFVQVLDTNSANIWDKYERHAGGIAFKLLGNGSNMFKDTSDSYLSKAIEQYVSDCSVLPLATGTVNANELRRTTESMVTTLAKFMSKANSTIYYSEDSNAEKAGVLVSCEDAWTNIAGKLSGTTPMEPIAKQMCSATGFDVNHATYGPNQLAQCKALIASTGQLQGITTPTWDGMAKNLYLSQAILEAIRGGGIDIGTKALTNRTENIQAIGASQSITEWMPRIRGFMLTVILALIPITVIFLVTPLAGKALSITIGFIVWYTLWSIADAAMHQSAMDSAYRLFEQVTNYKAGLDSFALLPETTANAYAIFGTARLTAFGLAGMLTAALFKLSVGSTLSGIAGRSMEKIRSTAEQTSLQTGTIEGQSGLVGQFTGAGASLSNYSQHGFQNMMREKEYTQSMSIQNASSQLDWGEKAGSNLHQTAGTMGQIQAGGQTGRADALSTMARMYNVSPGEMAERVSMYDGMKSNMGSMSYAAALERINPEARGNKEIMAEEVFKETYYQHYDSLMRSGGIGEAVNRVTDLAYQKTGDHDLAMRAGDIAYQRFQHSDALAKVNAYGTDGEKALSVESFAHSQKANETVGKMRTLGDDAKAVQENVGVKAALDDIGVDAAIRTNSASDIAKSTTNHIAAEAHKAKATDNYANTHYSGNTNELFENSARLEVAQQQADYRRASFIADTFFDGDMDRERMARGMEGEYHMPAQQILQAMENDPKLDALFSQEQKSLLQSQPNHEAQFNFDPVSGEFSNVRTFSGSESFNSKRSEVNYQNEVSAGTRADVTSFSHLLRSESPDDRSLMVNHVSGAWDEDHREATIQNLATDWANALRTKADYSSTEYRAGTANVGGDASGGLGSGSAKDGGFFKTGISGGINASWQYSDDGKYDQLQTHLEEKLHAFDKTARSEATNQGQTEQEKQALYGEFMMVQMKHHHNQMYDEMNKEALNSRFNQPMNNVIEDAEDNRKNHSGRVKRE